MIPRHPNRHVDARPRTWADAQSVAAGLCRPVPADRPLRAVDENARQLIAALVLTASYTSRPTQDAVQAWLRTPGALEDTVRPILDEASYAPTAHRKDAQAALAVLRRGDHDHTVSQAITAAALRALRSPVDASNIELVAAPTGEGQTEGVLRPAILNWDGPVAVTSRRRRRGVRGQGA